MCTLVLMAGYLRAERSAFGTCTGIGTQPGPNGFSGKSSSPPFIPRYSLPTDEGVVTARIGRNQAANVMYTEPSASWFTAIAVCIAITPEPGVTRYASAGAAFELSLHDALATQAGKGGRKQLVKMVRVHYGPDIEHPHVFARRRSRGQKARAVRVQRQSGDSRLRRQMHLPEHLLRPVIGAKDKRLTLE